MRPYSLSELRSLPTLAYGQADSLKVETSTMRVWLSRCGPEDGEPYPNKVTVERLVRGRWIETETYQAR